MKEKYPEINLEVVPYSGKNMTAYVTNQLRAGDMPDIYMTTVYAPGLEDLAPKVKATGYYLALNQIALSGYGFQYLCNILDTDFLNTIDGHTGLSPSLL